MKRAFENHIAQRYLKTRRKGAFVRTLLRFARWGVAIGVFTIVVSQAMMAGWREGIQNLLFKATAHFSIHPYSDSENWDTDEALKIIKNVPGVKAVNPFRMDMALSRSARSGQITEPLMLKAVEPETARATSSLFDNIKPIAIESLQPGQVIVGQDFARQQGLRVGDDLQVILSKIDLGLSGMTPKVKAFTVAGIFHSRNSLYDRGWAFVHLDDAKAWAQSEQADGIEITLTDIQQIKVKQNEIRDALGSALARPFITMDQMERNRELFAGLDMLKWIFLAVMSLIVIVNASSITAVLVLLVAEKRRDIGTLLALGATPGQIQRIFQAHGLRMAVVGTLAGLVAALPLCAALDHFQVIQTPAALVDFLPYFPFKLRILDIVFAAAFPIIVAFFASRNPAKKASELNPIETLRAE
ncbi:MAG: ABC transporter permease [Holophagales bacterium]|jgi:lipoprotein-releasing system permease protein|nr:ABC transporter permease [Holophagales bacterium]